jgi:glutamyl-tRNA(Gln) amidotransferase subunit E
MDMAIETVEERCRMAFDGVPNETRKALADGTTLFERVLPGADRMYPDTDSAPIPIDESAIEEIRAALPVSIDTCRTQMRDWKIPVDCQPFILKRALFPLLIKLVEEQDLDPVYAGTLIGHTLRAICGDRPGNAEWLLALAQEIRQRKLDRELIKTLLPIAFLDPIKGFDEILASSGYSVHSETELLARALRLKPTFSPRRRRASAHAQRDWIMGKLRPAALGNMSLATLAQTIEQGGSQ